MFGVSNDSIGLIRTLAYAGLLFGLAYTILKWILGIKSKICLINSLPGPTSFSTLLGNIPFEVVKHVGGNFEDAKDLYHSEY